MSARSGLYRIGVDVGGTNTDAAIINIANADSPSRGVCASSKTPTTSDVTTGIYTVIENVLANSQVNRDDVLSVAIGTTHFVNAVVQADARRLKKVAVVRLCGPFTRQVPPFVEFPPALKEIMGGPVFYLDGGLEIDGREITSLNLDQVKATVKSIQDAGVEMVALVGVFSPLDHSGKHEETCKKQMLELDPSLTVVCSHEIGGVGLLERENATVLNASILPLAKRTVRAFCKAMAKLHLNCTLFLTQNDGTLTDAATAAELPIKTFASGPTNSMTGAAFLASLDKGSSRRSDTQVIVVDVGGTTSDACALLPSGFPRQAPNFVEVGGVRTAFSMPEVLSIGLGGGSKVVIDEKTGNVNVGPESVGHYLTSKAMVFGGDVMTATDIVTASGAVEIGDVLKVKDIPSDLVSKACTRIKKILERAVDDMKVSDAPVTLLLVGGGSVVLLDQLEGVQECIMPPHHDSANAVGAAIAKVAGEVDIIEILADRDEREVIETAKRKAVETAVARGADRNDVKIVEIDKLPLQYVTNKATRFVIKAVGKLAPPDPALPRSNGHQANGTNGINGHENGDEEPDTRPKEPPKEIAPSAVKHSAYMDIETYRPSVKNGVWYVSPVDLEFIATGTGVLGTGGGGPSRIQYFNSLEYLKDPKYKGRMRVIPPSKTHDSDICVFGSWYGAPSVSAERIPSGKEIMTAIEYSAKIAGYNRFDAVLADEIGGGNGLVTFPTSAHYDIPVIDGDLMGRAYPTLEHGTAYVYGHSLLPCACADSKGNASVVLHAESHRRVETMLRSQCVDLGLKIAVAPAPLTGDVIKQYAIPNTVSQAWYIGRAIHRARKSKSNFIDAIFETTPGKLLYTGKIIDVKRDVSKGYTMGECTLAPLALDEQESPTTTITSSSALPTQKPTEPEPETHLLIPFQNEYLYAASIPPCGDRSKQEIICTVPDLISILGQDGEALGSQELRYGLKVNVIGFAAHPLWTADERGLDVGGPKGFGLDMQWMSLGEYQRPRSVVEEFDVVG